MKKFLIPIALCSSLTAVGASSRVLLNGDEIESFKVESLSTGVVRITTVPLSGNPPPPPPTDGSTDGSDAPEEPTPTVPSNCPRSGYELTAKLDWKEPGSQTRIDLAHEVKSTQFTATSSSYFYGTVSATSTTGNSYVKRRLWVSSCPGGTALNQGKSCDRVGTSNTTLYWQQGGSSSYKCILTPGETYYLNYRNEDCDSGSCDIYRNVYSVGKP